MSTIKLKRSAVPGRIPSTANLDLGEVGINTYDGYIYLKRAGISGEEVVRFTPDSTSTSTSTTSTDALIAVDSFVGTGSQTQFTLSVSPAADQYSFVTINGVDQHVSAYSIVGKVLTFSEAPVASDEIEVRTISQQVGSVQLRDYKTYIYQPTVATTTFAGADIYGNVLAYDLDKVEVFVNGVRLVAGLDYTASNSTSIVLPAAITSGDTLEVVSLARAAFVDWDAIKPNNTSLTSTTADQVVDSFSAGTYRTAKYLISMAHATLGYHATEVLAIHDGTTVYMTEYGTVFTQASLGTFDGSIVSGMVRLTVTPINTNTTVKLQRITVAV